VGTATLDTRFCSISLAGRTAKTGRANVALSRAFGFTTVLSQPKREGFGFEERSVGLLADTALSEKKPCITVELTPTYNWEELAIEAAVKGTLNVLRHLDMIPGDVEEQDPSLPIIPQILGPQLRVTPRGAGWSTLSNASARGYPTADRRPNS
jgi:hypothetical protein